MKNITFIILGVIVLIIISLLFLFQTHIGSDLIGSQDVPTEITADEEVLEPKLVPEGWKTYVNSNLLKGRIAFAYPPHWELTEMLNTEETGMGQQVRINGDGFSIKFQGHGGVPPYMELASQPYVVDGKITRTWVAEINGQHKQTISVRGTEFVIWVDTPGQSTEMSDLIISTISLR